MVGVVQLCGDPDVLALGGIGIAEHLFKGNTHLFVVSIGIGTIYVPVTRRLLRQANMSASIQRLSMKASRGSWNTAKEEEIPVSHS